MTPTRSSTRRSWPPKRKPSTPSTRTSGPPRKDYLDIAQDRKNSVDDIFAVISDKDYAFTLLPEKVFKTAVFMGKVGTLKDPPAKWQELFFPDIHSLPGD